MNPIDGMREFSERWHRIAKVLLSEKPFDFENGAPKGATKAITQIDTGVNFATMAAAIEQSKLPITRHTLAKEWIAAELSARSTSLADLRLSKQAYVNMQKRVLKSIDTEIGHLSKFNLIKVNVNDGLSLTDLGNKIYAQLRG